MTAAASQQLTAQLAEALELWIAQHVEGIGQQTPLQRRRPRTIQWSTFNPTRLSRMPVVPASKSIELAAVKTAFGARMKKRRADQAFAALHRAT
jgi:hypothetical protein